MKKFGCIRFVFFLLLAVCCLYFTVGEGKTRVMKKIYPIKYQEYVEKFSEEYGLDKNLVYAIIKVESNFDETAVSVADAKGLMQLMDNTAEGCNKEEDFGYTIPNDLFDPECNIRIGCYYISKLIDHYGNARLAVTAYNGGTGNVQKWLKDETLSDGLGGLKKIPYKETERYVKKVFKTFEKYNTLYKISD